MAKTFTIGIDLGGTNLKIALFNKNLRCINRHILSTTALGNKDALIAAIIGSVRAILARNRISREQVVGVGMGLPGPIDVEKGVVHFFPNIPGWKDVALERILEKALQLPVRIDNDANVMALAEFKRGAARGSRNAVCITLGTGVGGGLIIDGALYRGSGFAAGEIGHMPVNEEGPDCNCGGSGCLEAYVGNKRILSRARRVFKRQISLEELSRRAQRGDRKAIALWSEVGLKLGVALTGVVNLLNPDCIVIGGGVANAGKILFDTIKETIYIRAMIVQAKQVKVVKAKLGNEAGMIGAALLFERG
ncbi:MAG TPA: ROK family protein [Candidatus Omnitrophota bacterium]|nr:ROK family protein [Candidatus Omnitrophota bacterium]HRZ15596.1 ROK family protein [Candidatus Omnitrophota bacterium]